VVRLVQLDGVSAELVAGLVDRGADFATSSRRVLDTRTSPVVRSTWTSCTPAMAPSSVVTAWTQWPHVIPLTV
jgi:hypothetical protein